MQMIRHSAKPARSAVLCRTRRRKGCEERSVFFHDAQQISCKQLLKVTRIWFLGDAPEATDAEPARVAGLPAPFNLLAITTQENGRDFAPTRDLENSRKSAENEGYHFMEVPGPAKCRN